MGNYRAEVGGRVADKPLQDSNSTGFGGRCQAVGGSTLGAPIAQAVDQVVEGENGVGKEHTRSGVAHHRSDLIALAGRIAVNRACAAGGLVLLERATAQPFLGIGKEFAALLARDGLTAMVISTEALDHGCNGPGFTLHAS